MNVQISLIRLHCGSCHLPIRSVDALPSVRMGYSGYCPHCGKYYIVQVNPPTREAQHER